MENHRKSAKNREKSSSWIAGFDHLQLDLGCSAMRKGGPKKVSIKAIRYSGESIGKAIVLFLTLEFLQGSNIGTFTQQKFVSAKWLYRSIPQNF
jgi:hypothetical protein